MATTVITGSIYHAGTDYPWISASVQLVLLDWFSASGRIYPASKYVAITGSGGDFAASLVRPSSGSAVYKVVLPSGEIVDISLNASSASVISIDTLM